MRSNERPLCYGMEAPSGSHTMPYHGGSIAQHGGSAHRIAATAHSRVTRRRGPHCLPCKTLLKAIEKRHFSLAMCPSHSAAAMYSSLSARHAVGPIRFAHTHRANLLPMANLPCYLLTLSLPPLAILCVSRKQIFC